MDIFVGDNRNSYYYCLIGLYQAFKSNWKSKSRNLTNKLFKEKENAIKEDEKPSYSEVVYNKKINKKIRYKI